MKFIEAVALAAAVSMAACGSGEESPPPDSATAVETEADSGHAGHVMNDQTNTTAHAAHDSSIAGEHDAHARGATTGAHAEHVGAAPAGEHDAHAPSAGAVSHARHAAPRDSTSHEAHAGPAREAHAGHAEADGTNARHDGPVASIAEGNAGHTQHAAPETHPVHADAPARADESHAGHQPSGTDTTHAEHMETRDTSHPGHVGAGEPGHADHPEAAEPAHDGHAAAPAQEHAGHVMAADTPHAMDHEMAMLDLGRTGWMAIGMAQVFPTFSMALPSEEGSPLSETGFYATQPAIMLNLESPLSRVSFRTTLNFEGLTQPEGELTFGGWGEGFLDKRHPHTLVHEAMLSANVWARDGGGFSLSAGKGFAPYGTDDPMSRPVLKYPTNHHLSQILERFTLNGVYSSPRWSVEVGVFGGNEPTGPYDFSNAESFANSWSTRVARRFGNGAMGIWDWELAGSYGYVVEEHDDEEAVTRLYNAALRHEHDHSFGRMYALVEASMSDPDHHNGFFSVLGEASVFRGRHNPYGRVEFATRPEYPRKGEPGEDDFFRYDHDDEPLGSTRWLIVTGGYGVTLTGLPWSLRPYVEAQWNQVSADEGDIDPEDLFGRSSFFGLSLGARMFVGGEPMRMGSYGVLDSMTLMHRMQMEMAGNRPDSTGHADH